MKKLIIASALSTVAIFAGKNVATTQVEPIPVVAPAMVSNAIALKVGTLGVGVDIEHMFNKKHAIRLNVNGLKVSRSKELDDIDYDLDLKLLSAGLLYDYHPWESSFRLSVGLYYNGNKIEGTARPKGSVKIGEHTYTFTNERIDAKIDFKKVAPYIGFGWSSVEKDGWHFTADVGVMYSGTPKVNITTNAAVSASDINDEIKNVKDDIENYKWWPVVSIGIQKKF